MAAVQEKETAAADRQYPAAVKIYDTEMYDRRMDFIAALFYAELTAKSPEEMRIRCDIRLEECNKLAAKLGTEPALISRRAYDRFMDKYGGELEKAAEEKEKKWQPPKHIEWPADMKKHIPTPLEKWLKHTRPKRGQARLPLECADGFLISVQAGNGYTSAPASDICPVGYSRVEVMFTSENEPLIGDYRDSISKTYRGVPAELVDKVIEKHGGIKEAEGQENEKEKEEDTDDIHKKSDCG